MKKTQHFQNCLGVFQGGGVKAIAYAGAYEEAINRSVFFSELIGASAGSIIAVLIAAGATPQQLKEILAELDFQAFLRPPKEIDGINVPSIVKWIPNSKKLGLVNDLKKFSKYLGLHDGSYIRDWINEKLKLILNIGHTPTFEDLYIPTTVIATDLKKRCANSWGYHNKSDDEVGLAVQLSCLMPFFFQPHEKRYVDGGMLSNLPSYLLKPATIFDKILAFGFEDDGDSQDIKSSQDYFMGLANTVVDGAMNIQLELQQNIHSLRINTLDIKSIDFKKLNKQLVDKLVDQGRLAAKTFFDNEHRLETQYQKREDVAIDIFESFNLLLKSMNNTPQEILLSDDMPTWMYSLFPLLLKWHRAKVDVKVLLKKGAESQIQRDYKIRLLKLLGFGVHEVKSIPFRGFIINGYHKKGQAIILSDQNKEKIHSTYLEGQFHSEVIKLLRQKFNEFYSGPPAIVNTITLTTTQTLLSELRNVSQYKWNYIAMNVEEVNILDLTFLTKYVKGYKYRQIDELFMLYKQNQIDTFEPVLLNYGLGKSSLITPPIIEVHDSKLIVIEGNARFLHAYKNGITKLKSVVVRGVREKLPSSGRYSIKQVLISDAELRGNKRYANFDKDLFRKIEETIHNPQTSLW